MVASLCKVLGRAKSTIYDWASQPEKQSFSDALKEVEERQHSALVNGGLTGKFTAPISKLMLANHGYCDKQEVKSNNVSTIEHSGSVTVTKEEAKEISDALNDEC